MAGAILHYLKW